MVFHARIFRRIKEMYTLRNFYACWQLMLRKLKKICNMQNEATLAQTMLDKMSNQINIQIKPPTSIQIFS